MKILAFVDMHGNKDALDRIERMANKENVDYIICGGDLTIFGDNYETIMQRLDAIGKPVLYIHGNHETEKKSKKLCKKSQNIIWLHKNKIIDGEYMFVGWGGGGFSKRDKEFEQWVKKEFPNPETGKKVVLVTHAPPADTKLDRIWNESAGCKSIRIFIEKVKPVLAISGHLHENFGAKDKIGPTRVVNPGPAGKIYEI